MSQSGKESPDTNQNFDLQLKQKNNGRNKKFKYRKEILIEKLHRNKLIAVIIIIVIGMSGVIVLTQSNIFQKTPSVSSKQVDLVDTGKGNFKQDLNATTLFIGHKVVFVYIGGQFCPYCAMERWAIVMALSNFGTFSNPTYIYSSEGNITTYDFTKITYSSSTIDFESVENSGQNGNLLEPLTGLPLSLYSRYDTQNYIPFIVIGGLYVQIGPGPSLNTLDFSGVTYQTILSQIQASSGKIYNEILIESNIMISFINQLLTQQSNITTMI